MVDDPASEDDRPAANSAEPDACGQAALLLVESLIHGLIERSLITVGDAVEIVDVAADVKAAANVDDVRPRIPTVLGMLEMIRLSLRSDL